MDIRQSNSQKIEDKRRKKGTSNRKTWIDEEGNVVWWDWKGIVHYAIIARNQTINSELYYEQLERLQQAIERKRPELINRRCRLPSRQRSTIHIFDNLEKIARAWLESLNASTV